MELVIDANEVISALISFSGKTSDLIFSEELNLFSPEYLLEELDKHTEELLKKSRLSKEKLDTLLSLLSLNIEFIPFSEFEKFEEEASKICSDENDVEYVALALKLNCPLWSEDKALRGQSKVKIISTSELLKQCKF